MIAITKDEEQERLVSFGQLKSMQVPLKKEFTNG